MELLPKVAEKLGVEERDPIKLCDNEKINEFILNEITKQGKEDGLKGFELARKIKLWPKPFMQMGICTNTMKLQRRLAKKIFSDEIKKLYEN